jgi:hypothetical protein
MKRSTKKGRPLSTWFRKSQMHFARPKFTEPYFAQHTKSIGQLLLAWNDLHERLCALFVEAMGAHHIAQSHAIWIGTFRDGEKRRLLQRSIENLSKTQMKGRPKVAEEIDWILKVAQELEGFRDDSAHTPLLYTSTANQLTPAELILAKGRLPDPEVFPNTGWQNPKAVRLINKNLIVERRYAKERVLILRDYAIAISYAWMSERLPWPDRPDLPDRKPSPRRKSRVAHPTQK